MGKGLTFGNKWFDRTNNNFVEVNKLCAYYNAPPNYQAPTVWAGVPQDSAPAAETWNWLNVADNLAQTSIEVQKENYEYYQSLPPQPDHQDLSDNTNLITNLDVQTDGTSDNNYQNLSLQDQKQGFENVLQGGRKELIETLLKSIEIDKKQITEKIEGSAEADISENTNDLFQKIQEFLIYSTVDQLRAGLKLGKDAYTTKVSEGGEWHEKAQAAFQKIIDDPIYSREINNEQEQRDACERILRFIGETTARLVALGLGFGAAAAVASLMIPAAMVLYGPIIVAGPALVAGAGGAAAFMANKFGYKMADLTISNTAALVGRLLDWSKNGIRNLFKDKQQEKALTKLKNKLLQEIEKAQLGFITAKNEYDQVKVKKEPHNDQIQKLQSQMTEHLENLYINASVLKELETSIVKQRQAEQKQKEALEKWQKLSLIKKAAQKIGESDTWKSIREIGPRNICEKFGATTGKILGYAAAAGLAAAAAIFITSFIGAAATILYGPMAVVGITAAAGIMAGAVSHKVADPVATWSGKQVGVVADLAKNAIYEVAKYIAVGTKNVVMGKGTHSNNEQRKKASTNGKKAGKN